MQDTPRTVREISDHIRDLFDGDPLLSDLWIAGEVVESTVSRSGHIFFTLASEGAQIRCVLFRMSALRQRTLPSAGSACVAHGRVEVYAAEGTYQFYVDLVEEAGIGLAALELELLRQQLEAEGLFSEARKRSLPPSPRVIGVVTSERGAVWHDIQNVIARRFPFAQVLLAPAAVQGDDAPRQMIEALQSITVDGRAEVIIIARGGGSVSDLSVFNDEDLVRAVFAAPVPVVSAVGHETDWSLLDFVADLRAPTPSAAAELVSPPIFLDLFTRTRSLSLHIDRFERELAERTMDVDRLASTLDRSSPAVLLRQRRSELNQARLDLATGTTSRMSERLSALDTSSDRLSANIRSTLDMRIARLHRAADLLQALSPAKTLSRGYAFVEHAGTGRPLKSAAEVEPGQRIRTRLRDGSFDSVVSTVSPTAT